jgi:predicted transcriptional regulator
MTVRKNFNFDDEVAKHLEELASIEAKSKTDVVQEAVELKYGKLEIQKKLDALEALTDSFHGLLTDVDAKEARVERALRRAK